MLEINAPQEVQDGINVPQEVDQEAHEAVEAIVGRHRRKGSISPPQSKPKPTDGRKYWGDGDWKSVHVAPEVHRLIKLQAGEIGCGVSELLNEAVLTWLRWMKKNEADKLKMLEQWTDVQRVIGEIQHIDEVLKLVTGTAEEQADEYIKQIAYRKTKKRFPAIKRIPKEHPLRDEIDELAELEKEVVARNIEIRDELAVLMALRKRENKRVKREEKAREAREGIK
jgi:hypothetical protein